MTWVYDTVNKVHTGYEGLGYSLLIAAVTCIFSLLCAVMLGLLDRRRFEKH